MSKDYEAAIEKASSKTKRFNEAQEAYRARLIGDDEFLAARERHQIAQAEFDAAFEAEKARGE